jgi:hypothetical protein
MFPSMIESQASIGQGIQQPMLINWEKYPGGSYEQWSQSGIIIIFRFRGDMVSLISETIQLNKWMIAVRSFNSRKFNKHKISDFRWKNGTRRILSKDLFGYYWFHEVNCRSILQDFKGIMPLSSSWANDVFIAYHSVVRLRRSLTVWC